MGKGEFGRGHLTGVGLLVFGVHASLGQMRPVETPARMTKSIDCSYLIGRRERAPSADMTWGSMLLASCHSSSRLLVITLGRYGWEDAPCPQWRRCSLSAFGFNSPSLCKAFRVTSERLPTTSHAIDCTLCCTCLTMSSEKSEDSKSKELLTRQPSVGNGELGVVDDQEVSDFYGDSVSDSYRLKSELVAQHLAEIGMGK